MRSYHYEKGSQLLFFKRKPVILKDRYERWRGVADHSGFTIPERLRVEWMVFYYTVVKENATLTAQHFGISMKTFRKWFKRFKDSKYEVHSLADRSRAPHGKRHWDVTIIQEESQISSESKKLGSPRAGGGQSGMAPGTAIPPSRLRCDQPLCQT